MPAGRRATSDANPPAFAQSVPLALTAALAWSYAPNAAELAARWRNDPDYNHGFFVIPIALAVAWRSRGRIARSARPWAWGWPILIAVLVARAFFFVGGERWSESATMPAVVAALSLTFLGPRATRRALPAIAFLGLMLPMPPSLNAWTADPLQRLATLGATALLQATGLPAISAGNLIAVESTTLEVARACSGLSMLLSFVTLVSAEALLSRGRTAAERVALIASAAPIALACNVIRIAATAWAYRLLGPEAGEKIAHDAAGWAMMPLALFLGWIEIRILGRLFVEGGPADAPAVVAAAPIRWPREPLALDPPLRSREPLALDPPRRPREPLALDPPRPIRLAPEAPPAQAERPSRPMIEGM